MAFLYPPAQHSPPASAPIPAGRLPIITTTSSEGWPAASGATPQSHRPRPPSSAAGKSHLYSSAAASASASSEPSQAQATAAYEDGLALYDRMRADTDPYMSTKVGVRKPAEIAHDPNRLSVSHAPSSPPQIRFLPNLIRVQVAAALDVMEQAIRLYGPEKVFASYNGGKVSQQLREA